MGRRSRIHILGNDSGEYAIGETMAYYSYYYSNRTYWDPYDPQLVSEGLYSIGNFHDLYLSDCRLLNLQRTV